MNAKHLWQQFKKQNQINHDNYEEWAFGDNPDHLAQLVLNNEKTATSSAYPLYQLDNEPLPNVGEYNIILNTKEEAICIIQTTKVYVIPFYQITQEHAYKEGEGDKSLTYWREVHQKFFTECMKEAGLEFNENMKVVCEEFKVVYKS